MAGLRLSNGPSNPALGCPGGRPKLSTAARKCTSAAAELRYPVSINDPKTGATATKDLIPDSLFGLEYHTEEGSRFRFFLVEGDRAAKPATIKNFNRKSWLRSLCQYEEYIGRRQYRKHLKLKSPLLVLNVVPDETRLKQLLAVTEKEAGNAGNPYQLFQTIEGFGSIFRPPSPIAELLETPWQRVGWEPFVEAEQKAVAAIFAKHGA